MGFSRQEYWSGLPCPPPGGLPDPGIGPASLAFPSLAGGFFTTRATWESPGGEAKKIKTSACNYCVLFMCVCVVLNKIS